MRATLLLCGSVALGAIASVAACAASEDEAETPPSPDAGGNEVVAQDGGAPEPDAEPDANVTSGPKCSDGGWCRTALPDGDLSMKDIWPLSGHTFAIAESPTLGVKVLAWSDADGAWRYIDDGTQNEPGLGTYAGRIWAPNANEVYFGVGPGYIYHGKSPVPPEATWTWTRQRLQDNSHVGFVEPLDGYPNYWKVNARYPALGVWGTSSDDVYAWFTNTIYHWTSMGGGAPEWVPEYVANDASASTEHMFFVGAAGTGPGDMWFSGARSRARAGCVVLVRKTSEGYERLTDGTLTGNASRCTARAGSLLVGGSEGWLVDIHARANGIVGLKGSRDAVRIAADGEGHSVAVAVVPTHITDRPLNSFWAAPEDLWFSSWGLVFRSGDDVWDGGAYQLSPLSPKGEPVVGPIYQIRGTSSANLWAIGVRNALHKTTP